MITFKKKRYPKDMHPEMKEVCDAINCIPGVATDGSCNGHDKHPPWITLLIDVSDPMGYFFFLRCIDRRYWKYGYVCRLRPLIGDAFRDDIYPIYYRLSFSRSRKGGMDQMKSLVSNITAHLNHKNFLKGYDIDLRRFDVKGKELGDNWVEEINKLWI